MRKRYIAIFLALFLLVFPTNASAAPLLDLFSSGSLGSAGSLGSSGDSESYVEVDPTSGTLIATSGFEVKTEGFSFENWGEPTQEHRRGLTPTMMQSLYGDRICARITAGECVLTATGEALQVDLNDSLSGGHCFGFAALAGLFATDQLDTDDYLPTGQSVYGTSESDDLDGLISRYASTQFSAPTSDAESAAPVAETLDKLKAAWARGESYLLAFAGAVGGHAVTPISLRDLGNGKTGIVMYDNNFPGVEKMMVANAAANTWYYTTALNPADKSYLFVGSPENELVLIDLPQMPEVHECPICPDSGDESVLVLVKDNAENEDGTIIDWALEITAPGGGEVDGIEMLPVINNQQSVMFRVPAGVAFEMSIGGVPAGRSADIDISLFGDGWMNEIDEITLLPGATTLVSVDQDQRKLRMSSNRPVSPVLMISSQQANWSVSAQGTGLQLLPGSTLSVERDTDGDYVYALDGAGDPGSMTLYVLRRDSVADQVVTTGGPVSIPVNSSASVAANAWDGVTPLTVRVEGDGTDETYPMIVLE